MKDASNEVLLERLLEENTRRAEAAVRTQRLEEERLEVETRRYMEQEKHATYEQQRVGILETIVKKIETLIQRVNATLEIFQANLEMGQTYTISENQTNILQSILELLRVLIQHQIVSSSEVDAVLDSIEERLKANRRIAQQSLPTDIPASDGLTAATIVRTRAIILSCCLWDHNDVDTVFVDSRIAPFKNRVPKAINRIAQANTIISSLVTQWNNEGENALVMFLKVLVDLYPVEDSCHARLMEIAEIITMEISSPA